MQKEIEVYNNVVLGRHFVGEKDGKEYDFWALSIKVGDVEIPVKFDKKDYKYAKMFIELLFKKV